MINILYATFLVIVFSISGYSQGFWNNGNAGSFMMQYAAPRHIQYTDYNYYYNSVVVKQNVPVVKSKTVDYIEYQPVYMEYNWITPSSSRLPPSNWQGYQPYVVYPYKYVPCQLHYQLWHPYSRYWYYYPYSYQEQLWYFPYPPN